MRHLGQEREVSTEQAVLDKRVLRLLAGKCSLKMNAPAWRESMLRLEGWRFVSVEPTGHGNARSVGLTEEGKAWGEELACEINREVIGMASERCRSSSRSSSSPTGST
jgi:hypothetical protein